MSLDYWQAEQYRDECERIRGVIEIIEAAATRPLTKEERQILASEAGVHHYTKETR